MSDSYAVGGVTPVILTETSSDTTIADGAVVTETNLRAVAASQAVPGCTQIAAAIVLVALAASQFIPAPTQSASAKNIDKVYAAQTTPAPTQSATVATRDGINAAQTASAPIQSAALQNLDNIQATQAASAPSQSAAVQNLNQLYAAQTAAAPTQSATIGDFNTVNAAQVAPAPSQSAGVVVGLNVTAGQRTPAPRQIAQFSHPSVGAIQLIPPAAQIATVAVLDQIAAARAVPAPVQIAVIRIPAAPTQVATLAVRNDVAAAQIIPPPLSRASLNDNGPFYVCWVDATDTTFGPQHLVNDFLWSRAAIDHRENSKPVLAFDMPNPKEGLLNPQRKQWLWFSWKDVQGTSGPPGTVYPLFFGHVDGLLKQINGEKVRLKVQAEAIDAVSQLQQVAEGLKVRPFYDPLWLDPSKRDDPAAILEGYSKSYHYDRIAVAGSVSVSDWIDGEDGTEEFTADEVPYRNLTWDRGQPPLTSVRIETGVTWTQTDTGIVDFGTHRYASYYGGIKQEWPAPGSQLGGGWSVNSAVAVDENLVELATLATYTYHWQNLETSHRFGDPMSLSASMSFPIVGGKPDEVIVYNIWNDGVLEEGGPSGLDGLDFPEVNIPAHGDESIIYVCHWSISASLQLRYRAARSYSENFAVTIVADVQPTTVLPPSNLQTELISLPFPDVGRPLVNVLNWSSVAGKPVTAGTTIYPNFTTDQTVPGAQSFQIYTVDGTAGTSEPTFSDTVGEPTTDGTATCVSLGTSPQLDARDWNQYATVPAGFVLNPVQPLFLDYSALTAPGLTEGIPTGTGVSYGQVIRDPNGNYQQCTIDGITGVGAYAVGTWGTTHGVDTADGTVTWTCIGSTLPDGEGFFLCVSGGETDEILPDFNYTLHGTTNDAGAVWMYIGTLGDSFGIPVGGTLGHVLARQYFATDRGRWSAENLLCRGRARLLWRARTATVTSDCSFDRAIALSCRKNALIHDDRLPGGQALGKIIGYQIMCDGPGLLMKGRVTIGCAAGNGNALVPGAMTTLATGDLAYAPPAGDPLDDGIALPITDASQITIDDEVVNSMDTELTYVDVLLKQQKDAQLLPIQLQAAGNPSDVRSIMQQIADQKLIAATPQFPVWQKWTLKPLAGQSFSTTFNVATTKQMVDKQIDLGAI